MEKIIELQAQAYLHIMEIERLRQSLANLQEKIFNLQKDTNEKEKKEMEND